MGLPEGSQRSVASTKRQASRPASAMRQQLRQPGAFGWLLPACTLPCYLDLAVDIHTYSTLLLLLLLLKSSGFLVQLSRLTPAALFRPQPTSELRKGLLCSCCCCLAQAPWRCFHAHPLHHTLVSGLCAHCNPFFRV